MMTYIYKIGIIYILILFLDRIDLTVLNVAIPTLTQVFGINISLAEWFSVSFLIGLTIAMSVSAWLGEKFGYKKVFISSVTLFCFFALCCSWVGSFELFILSRFFQGFFGGVIIACGNSILYFSCNKDEYGKITNFVFTATLLAPALAPIIGGTLLQYFSYKWIFYINFPICLIVVILSIFVIKDKNIFEKPCLDYKGVISSSILYICFFVGVSMLSLGKIGYALLLMLMAIFFALIFFKIEQKVKNPICDFSYFKRELFTKAVLIQLFFQMSHFGSFFIIGLFLQVGIGFTPQQAAITISMQALGAILIKLPPLTYLYANIKLKHQLMTGLLGVTIITPIILLVFSQKYLYLACFIMFFRGIFSGLIGGWVATMGIYEAKDKVEIGRMGDMFIIFRQLSISLGMCVSTLAIEISRFFGKINYLNFQTMYQKALYLFGLGIAIISIFCVICAWICYKINNDEISKLKKSKKYA